MFYIRMKGRHIYLIAIMDWYSRYVIHWAVSPNMEAEFCVEALRNALLRGRCEIFNTDQGSQVTSKDRNSPRRPERNEGSPPRSTSRGDICESQVGIMK